MRLSYGSDHDLYCAYKRAMQDYPRLRCSSGDHDSNKGTAGAITRLCNRLLDVIVSDKVRSQRSFQSVTLLQNIKAVTNTAAGSGVCVRLV